MNTGRRRKSHSRHAQDQTPFLGRVDEEAGALLVFLAIGGLAIVLGFASLMLNYDVGSYVRRAGQSAIDTAALSAANTFCSTEACFGDALAVATDSLEGHLPDALGLGSTIDFPVADGPVWDVTGIKVTIQRGRWWPDGVPTNIAPYIVTHSNGNFEPLDLLDTTGGTWQEGFPGVPQHIVANAVYVKIEYTYEHKILNIFGTATTQMVQETYAAAGQMKNASVCVAPFAIPVCALLNESGEFDKDVNCRYERYFTGTDRYCPPGDPDCDILPGSTWTPMIDPDDYEFHGNFNPVGMPSRENHFRPSCSWETYPRAIDIRDHHGYVGLPHSATVSGAIDEAEVLKVIDSSQANANVSGGCANAKLGEPFVVLEDGLTNNVNMADVNPAFASSDELVWAQIQDETEGALFHPNLKDSMLKGGAPTVRYHENYAAIGAKSLTFLAPDPGITWVGPGSTNALCSSWPRQRHGHCNSKHMISDNEWFAGYFPDFYDCPNVGFSGYYGVGSCWCDHWFTPSLYEYFDVFSRPPSGLSGPFWYPGGGGSGYWDPNAYFDTSLPTLAGSQGGRTLPVWKVPIPVIASLGDLMAGNPAASCDGVNEDPSSPIDHDPNYKSSETYIIIGFIDTVLYDTDIGALPPLDSSSNNCETFGPAYGILAGRRPLGFEVGGVKTPCNVVKGTSHCTNNVLSSVLAFQENSTPAGRLYAAGVNH
jgi:hypothetical protein